MSTEMYRGYEISRDSIVGGMLISKDGEFVDRVVGGMHLARHTVDEIILSESIGRSQEALVFTRLLTQARHGDRACVRHRRGIRHEPHLWDRLRWGTEMVVEGKGDHACNGAPLGPYGSDEEWAEAEAKRKALMD